MGEDRRYMYMRYIRIYRVNLIGLSILSGLSRDHARCCLESKSHDLLQLYSCTVELTILRSHTADFHFITMHTARTFRLWSELHIIRDLSRKVPGCFHEKTASPRNEVDSRRLRTKTHFWPYALSAISTIRTSYTAPHRICGLGVRY